MSTIYHITSRSIAQAAKQAGEYRSESLVTDGIIHFSQLHQLLGVANAFYAGQKDLVILVVDSSLLKAELRYEAPVHPGNTAGATVSSTDQRFPHLYGPLNFEAVIKIVDLPLPTGGSFNLPAL